MRIVEAGPLTLEPQTAVHAAEMFDVLSDPAIYEYENAPPASVEWLRARFEKLETRYSADGSEQWLNWVIRMTGDGLIGYVQATLRTDGSAAIAYEMSSAHWGRGLGRRATEAMLARARRSLRGYHDLRGSEAGVIFAHFACSRASASRARVPIFA